jgi:4-amino-4-deoxy-L-arabinose transferase-like glycosyltransferase
MTRLQRLAAALKPHCLGAALALIYLVVLVRTAPTLGYARDEGFYFHASTDYARWFDLLLHDRRAALTRGAIDAAWATNHEHPALMKSLFGLSWLFLHEKWHWISSEGLSFRLPGMIMGALGLWVTFLFGHRAHSTRAGLVAAVSLAFMPRIFYHAHLDCFDVPVMTMWVVVLYAYWRSLGGGLGWAIATGVAWGLALETKHNAWFVPFLVVTHFVLTRAGDLRRDTARGNLPLPLALVSMALLGPVIFVGLWPWMWFDTLSTPGHAPGRFQEYAGFHLNHAYYNMEWMGHNWFHPPFPRLYSWGMVLFTVPGITLLLFVIGLALMIPTMVRESTGVLGWLPLKRLRTWADAHKSDDPRGTWMLVFLGFMVPMAPWLSRNTPIFGGTKHWFPAYPFLALLAGVGFARVAALLEELLRDRVRRAGVVTTALGVLVVLPPIWQSAHSHPFGLSNYTPIAGGAPGAADRGLNRQFWGFTTGSLAPWFNREAPPNAGVYIHDTTFEAWNMLQRDGRLRQDLRPVWQVGEGEFAIVHHELHMNEVDYQIWTAYQSPSPAHVLTYDGVPIVSVYRNPRGR